MANRRMREITPDRGLHIAKGDVQKTFMQNQFRQLIDCWEPIRDRTREICPVRKKGFMLDRENGGMPSRKGPESRWERALWNLWGPQITPPAAELVPGVCQAIQTYQMPLKQHGNPGQINRKWGEVDLVGTDRNKHPVLIELKEPASKDPPLLAIMEVAAYGIAFSKSWDSGGLRREWDKVVGGNLPKLCPSPLKLVVAAPPPYWKTWDAAITKCSREIGDLRKLLKRDGFGLSFARLDCCGERLY